MNVVVFGAKGYLGREFRSLYPGAVCPEIDIADPRAVAEALDAAKPDVVINAAGKTGRPNVDWCEDHKTETVRGNITGPLVLLDACLSRGILLVHLGSGCIYEGDATTPFSEDDPPNFFGSFYAKSKAIIDMILQDFPVLILRLRMPFDGTTSERNLIMKLRKYDRVLDAENSLTYLPDFLAAAKVLIDTRATGVYHVVNPGVMSPYRIMEMYKALVDPRHAFTLLRLQELPQVTKAARSNCVLSTVKLAKEGISMRPVEEAVAEALRNLSLSVSTPRTRGTR